MGFHEFSSLVICEEAIENTETRVKIRELIDLLPYLNPKAVKDIRRVLSG